MWATFSVPLFRLAGARVCVIVCTLFTFYCLQMHLHHFLARFPTIFFCSFRTHSWRHSRMFMEFEPHLIHFLHLLLRCHSRRLVSFIHKNDKRHCTSVGRRFSYTLLFCSTHHEAAGSEQRTVCTTLNLKLSTRFSTLNNVNNVNYAVLQSWILTKNAAYTFVRD